MNKLTYKQARDRIIEAYFKDEIQPMNCNFCICGTLHGSGDWWRSKEGPYSLEEYRRLEFALLLRTINFNSRLRCYHNNIAGFEKSLTSEELAQYEIQLFVGMSAALDVLKDIHLSWGENIDKEEVFAQRKLEHAR